MLAMSVHSSVRLFVQASSPINLSYIQIWKLRKWQENWSEKCPEIVAFPPDARHVPWKKFRWCKGPRGASRLRRPESEDPPRHQQNLLRRWEKEGNTIWEICELGRVQLLNKQIRVPEQNAYVILELFVLPIIAYSYMPKSEADRKRERARKNAIDSAHLFPWQCTQAAQTNYTQLLKALSQILRIQENHELRIVWLKILLLVLPLKPP